jgi:hypothetical protein
LGLIPNWGTTSILILDLICSCVQRVLWLFLQDEIWSEHETDHATSSSTKIQNMWNFTFVSHMLHGATDGFTGNFNITLPYVLCFIALLFPKEIMVETNLFYYLFRFIYITSYSKIMMKMSSFHICYYAFPSVD